MPFVKAQIVLKRQLPPKIFDKVYDKASDIWDIYQKINDYFYYNLPSNDKRRKLLKAVYSHTMISRIGIQNTYDRLDEIIKYNVEGAFVECGVARGGCSAMMALMAKNENHGRMTWLFDSFEGLPPQTKEDGIQKPVRSKNRKRNDLAEGYCLGTFDEVYEYIFDKLHLDKTKVMIIKGWFENILPQARQVIGDISVLRLDSDWYSSVKCCLENLYENVVSGGYIIIDDYQLQGCKKAVDEFITKRQLNVNIDIDADGRAYWKKENL